jgi:hypothetical protein
MRKNIDYDQTNKLFTKLNKLMKIKVLFNKISSI